MSDPMGNSEGDHGSPVQTNWMNLHPDIATIAEDVEYFFLGDGRLACAVQWSRNRTMSPVGIALWNPEHFCRKESTYLFHPEFGLSRTMLAVRTDDGWAEPQAESTLVFWADTYVRSPAVVVEWLAGGITVREVITVHDGCLVRTVVHNSDSTVEFRAALYGNPYLMDRFSTPTSTDLIAEGRAALHLKSSEPSETFERFLLVNVPPSSTTRLSYSENRVGTDNAIRRGNLFGLEHEETATSDTTTGFDSALMEQFHKSRIGLRATVSESGRFDASIWQYGYEWGQDAALVVSAACMSGEFDLARQALLNLLERLVNPAGTLAESSRFRDGALSELTANGATLNAVADYAAWTGDRATLEWHKETIRSVANYVLLDEFSGESGALVGRRDIWERMPWHGLQSGYDCAANALCGCGLHRVSRIADSIGLGDEGARWSDRAEQILAAFDSESTFSFVRDGTIVPRLSLDGSVQDRLVSGNDVSDDRYDVYSLEVDESDPVRSSPDAVSALPILYGIVPTNAPETLSTLSDIHKVLWQQTGGYSRYPIEAEMDSPGPWPFPTAWIAEAALRTGDMDAASRATEWLISRAGRGGSWFEFYGHRPNEGLPPIGVIVWGWAQYIMLVVRGWIGAAIDEDSRLTISPRLSSLDHALQVGEYRVVLTVRGTEKLIVDGVHVSDFHGTCTIQLPLEKDVHVEFQ